MKPPPPLERDIHKAVARLLDLLLLPPAMWFSYPAGASVLSMQQAARHSELGLKRGLPDIWLLYGSVYCIELKRPGRGVLSKTRTATTRGGTRTILGQDEVFPKLLATRAVREIAICRSVDEALQQLERWQIPMRPYHRAGLHYTMSTQTELSLSSSTPTTRPRRSGKSPSRAIASCSTPMPSSRPG